MATVVRTAGYLSLYTGLSASVLRQLTYSTVRFGGYELMKRQWSGGIRSPSYRRRALLTNRLLPRYQ